MEVLLGHLILTRPKGLRSSLPFDHLRASESVTEDLAMGKVCAKLMSRMLSEQRKANEDPDFLDNIVTGDETWIFEYGPQS